MTDQPSTEEVMAALHSSGYLMEQEVATSLEAIGFHVETNVAFQDQDEGKSRELDVRAFKLFAQNEERKLAADLELLIECKKNSTPFVFISRPKNSRDQWQYEKAFTFPISEFRQHDASLPSNSYRVHRAYNHLGFDKVHHARIAPSKAVQFCRLERKGKDWAAHHGGLFDSIFYPMAKVISASLRDRPRPALTDKTAWQRIRLTVPLVVLHGDLLQFDTSTATLEKHGFVHFRRELKSATLTGDYSLDFVRQDYLEEFLNRELAPMLKHAQHLVEQEPDRVLVEGFEPKQSGPNNRLRV